ncbi:MAG: PDZ domain-containing protein [Planctomycetes bacterium]|nr:PDZ domain-containing protein [Planctomycetota bacterium]
MKRIGKPAVIAACFSFAFIACFAQSFGFWGDERKSGQVESYDVAPAGDLLLVPVVLGEKRYNFVVDTGASVCVFDTALQHQLVKQPDRVPINGDGEYQVFLAPNARFGSTGEEISGNCLALDLSRIREHSGYNVRGIAGMSVLGNHVIEVNFDAGKLSLRNEPSPSAGKEFRLYYNEQNLPMIEAEVIEGEPEGWILDTGRIGSSLTIRERLFEELVEKKRLRIIKTHASSAGVVAETPIRGGRLDSFRFGKFEHERVSVSEGKVNLIGLAYLSRYIVTLDFRKGRLYLKPGRRFEEPDRFGACGAWCKRVKGKTTFLAPSRGSSAEAAGLQEGDELLRIDGRSAASMSLMEINSIFKMEGRLVQIEVLGPDGGRKVEIQVSGPDDQAAEERK